MPFVRSARLIQAAPTPRASTGTPTTMAAVQRRTLFALRGSLMVGALRKRSAASAQRSARCCVGLVGRRGDAARLILPLQSSGPFATDRVEQPDLVCEHPGIG